jgi:esterase/lipase
MQLSILKKQKENLSGVLHEAPGKKLAIVCHGHTGNKGRPVPKEICETMQKAGYNTFRFDFSGNAESEGKFEDSTFSKCADDLRAVIDYFTKKGYGPIGIIGHSMGGTVCVMEAARDERVKFVVPISAPVHLGDSFKDYLAAMNTRKMKGEIQFYKEPTKEWLTVSKRFLNDLKKINLLKDVKMIHAPILFIHGTKDESVPITETEKLFVEANAPKEFVLVHGADHVFDGKEHLEVLLDEIKEWVKRVK